MNTSHGWLCPQCHRNSRQGLENLDGIGSRKIRDETLVYCVFCEARSPRGEWKRAEPEEKTA